MLNNAIQLECMLKFVDELTLILQTYKSICLNVNATVKVMDGIIFIFQLYATHFDTIIIEVISNYIIPKLISLKIGLFNMNAILSNSSEN